MTSIDEQREMRSTVAALLDRESDGRTIRDCMAREPGFDTQLWRRVTDELGLSAMLVPESAGGLGLDFSDAAVVLEEFGRRLAPSPLPETLVATAVLAACGTEQADRLLAEMADGGFAITAAVAEPGIGWDLDRIACKATESSGGGVDARLTGRKEFVVFGGTADVLLVVADLGTVGVSGSGSAGVDRQAVFAVRADEAGVLRRSRMTLDQTRRLADLDFDGAPAVRVSGAGDGARIAALLVNLSLVALAVESAAAAAAALEMTVEYLKVRQQFGRPLGSFQALKHRCADLAVLVDGATATAAHAVDVAAAELVGAGSADLALVAPLAKSVCADALRDVGAETIQLHGGIGFTFEHDAHLYFKRGKANQQLFGSGEVLRTRIGEFIGLT